MALTQAFRDLMTSLVAGAGGASYANANAHIGVGDSTAVFAAGQTDLQAATNKFRKAMDATFPNVAANVITFRATFGTADANFTWAEWGVFNAAAGGTMMNRLVQANGAKASSETKQFTATITLAV